MAVAANQWSMSVSFDTWVTCQAKRVNSENLPKQEKNRRNAGEGVRKEKWSKKGVSFPKQEGWQVWITMHF